MSRLIEEIEQVQKKGVGRSDAAGPTGGVLTPGDYSPCSRSEEDLSRATNESADPASAEPAQRQAAYEEELAALRQQLC